MINKIKKWVQEDFAPLKIMSKNSWMYRNKECFVLIYRLFIATINILWVIYKVSKMLS